MFSQVVMNDAKAFLKEHGCDAVQRVIDLIVNAIKMGDESRLRHLAEVKSAIECGVTDNSRFRDHA